jgi:hypothetical protein
VPCRQPAAPTPTHDRASRHHRAPHSPAAAVPAGRTPGTPPPPPGDPAPAPTRDPRRHHPAPTRSPGRPGTPVLDRRRPCRQAGRRSHHASAHARAEAPAPTRPSPTHPPKTRCAACRRPPAQNTPPDREKTTQKPHPTPQNARKRPPARTQPHTTPDGLECRTVRFMRKPHFLGRLPAWSSKPILLCHEKADRAPTFRPDALRGTRPTRPTATATSLLRPAAMSLIVRCGESRHPGWREALVPWTRGAAPAGRSSSHAHGARFACRLRV